MRIEGQHHERCRLWTCIPLYLRACAKRGMHEGHTKKEHCWWLHIPCSLGATHQRSMDCVCVFFLGAQTKMSWRSLLTSQYSR